MSSTTPGRRSSSNRVRLDTTTVLAVVLPLLTIGSLLLVRANDPATEGHAPTRTSLKSASVVCPTEMPGAPSAYLSTVGKGVHGNVGGPHRLRHLVRQDRGGSGHHGPTRHRAGRRDR